MKYIKLTNMCQNCLGCNLLELETFKGKYRCEYYIKGVQENDICDGNKNKSSCKR